MPETNPRTLRAVICSTVSASRSDPVPQRAGEDLEARAPHSPSERYPVETVERGLIALALHGGNTRRASQELADRGDPVPASTLYDWRTRTHAERWKQVQQEVAPQIQAKIASEAESAALGYAERVQATLDRYDETVAELKPAEVAGALRNLSTGFGISVDKMNAIRGNPTQIVEHRTTPQQIYTQLRQLGIEVLDGTAEEVPELPE